MSMLPHGVHAWLSSMLLGVCTRSLLRLDCVHVGHLPSQDGLLYLFILVFVYSHIKRLIDIIHCIDKWMGG